MNTGIWLDHKLYSGEKTQAWFVKQLLIEDLKQHKAFIQSALLALLLWSQIGVSEALGSFRLLHL